MRVAYVISSLEPGGAERQLVNTVNALPADIDVYVYVLRGEGTLKANLQNPRAEVKLVQMKSNADLAGWWRAAQWIRRWEPDVIHSHMLLSNMFARLVGLITPASIVINHEHGLSPWKPAVAVWADRYSQRLVSRVLVVSSASGAIRAAREKIPVGKVTVLRNAVECSRLAAVKAASPDGVSTWGMATRFIPLKRVDEAIKILAAVRDRGAKPRLLIAGDGPERGRVETLSRELMPEGCVEFLGHVEDMVGFYSQVDGVLVTSEIEDCPMVVLEGLAAGKFVIGTAVGGIPEILENAPDAFVFNPESDGCEVVRVISSVPPGFISDANRAYARKFCIESHVESLLGIYEAELART